MKTSTYVNKTSYAAIIPRTRTTANINFPQFPASNQPRVGYKKLEKELNKDRRSKEAGPEQKLRTQSGALTKYGRH